MTVHYRKVVFHPFTILKVHGSVIRFSLGPSLFAGLVSLLLRVWLVEESAGQFYFWDRHLRRILENNVAYTAYATLMGFLLTFRTTKAYDRFWNGCNKVKIMQAEYFVTASNLIAFCRHSSASPDMIQNFHHTLVRLLSMLHAVSLQQLEGCGDSSLTKFEIVDAGGIDRESLHVIQEAECRVELIIQWVQSLTVDGIKTGVCSIPPPILSRIFQNLSNGLSSYYSAYRVTEVPYPFPYVQTTETLLLIHLCVTPIVVCGFTTSGVWAFVFAFLSIFVSYSLNFIAAELENPFTESPNSLSLADMQREMNKRLLLLIKPTTEKVPTISPEVLKGETLEIKGTQCSFIDVWWREYDEDGKIVMDGAEAYKKALKTGIDRPCKMRQASSASKEYSQRVPESNRGSVRRSASPIPRAMSGEIDSLYSLSEVLEERQIKKENSLATTGTAGDVACLAIAPEEIILARLEPTVQSRNVDIADTVEPSARRRDSSGGRQCPPPRLPPAANYISGGSCSSTCQPDSKIESRRKSTDCKIPSSCVQPRQKVGLREEHLLVVDVDVDVVCSYDSSDHELCDTGLERTWSCETAIQNSGRYAVSTGEDTCLQVNAHDSGKQDDKDNSCALV